MLSSERRSIFGALIMVCDGGLRAAGGVQTSVSLEDSNFFWNSEAENQLEENIQTVDGFLRFWSKRRLLRPVWRRPAGEPRDDVMSRIGFDGQLQISGKRGEMRWLVVLILLSKRGLRRLPVGAAASVDQQTVIYWSSSIIHDTCTHARTC